MKTNKKIQAPAEAQPPAAAQAAVQAQRRESRAAADFSMYRDLPGMVFWGAPLFWGISHLKNKMSTVVTSVNLRKTDGTPSHLIGAGAQERSYIASLPRTHAKVGYRNIKKRLA